MGNFLRKSGEEIADFMKGESKVVSELGAEEKKALEEANLFERSEVEGEGIEFAGTEAEARVIQEGSREGEQEIARVNEARAAEDEAAHPEPAGPRTDAERKAAEEEKKAEIKNLQEGLAELQPPDRWASVKKFATAVVVEFGKGALLALGMEAVDRFFKAQDEKSEKKEKSARTQKVEDFVAAYKDLNNIKEEWQKWLLSRANLKDTFGTTEVESNINGKTKKKREQKKKTSLTYVCTFLQQKLAIIQ